MFLCHFVTNNYTVTLSIQNAIIGSIFQYVPNLRNTTDECYSEAQKVLDGNSSRVKLINLEPCELQIFKERHSLHRVTPVREELKK